MPGQISTTSEDELLDLDRVAPQIEAMARNQALRSGELQARLEAGLAQWRVAAAQPERFASLPRERNEPRLALPTHEPFDDCPSAPAPPDRFAVLAVDGSQIEPDFHEVAPCYLINVGHALLRYGAGADGTRLAADPALFYPGQALDATRQALVGNGGQSAGEQADRLSLPELAPGASRLAPDDEVAFGSWGDLDAQRMLAEAETLARLMNEQTARQEPALAFLDGPLIAWRLDWITPRAAKLVAARNFLHSFEAAKANGIPLAGYISRTRSTDLVNLLKFSACETAVGTGSFCAACAAGFRRDLSPGPSPHRGGGTEAVGGSRSASTPHPASPSSGADEASRSCPTTGTQAPATVLSPPSPSRGQERSDARGGGGVPPCYAELDGLIDRQLLAHLLPEPGMRSPVFQSNSSVLSNLYGEHRYVGFFFLNTGAEIGRVEVPQWVWEDPERLALVHALVYDQVTLGRGYPIALAEAHEQAVVRASERQLFFDLVRRAYGRYDVAAELSAKALRKRGPIA